MLYSALERELKLSCRTRSHPCSREVIELGGMHATAYKECDGKEASLRDSSEEGRVEKQAQAKAQTKSISTRKKESQERLLSWGPIEGVFICLFVFTF